MRLAKLLEIVDLQVLHRLQNEFRRSLLGKTLYHGSRVERRLSIERNGLTSEYNFFVLEDYGFGWDRSADAHEWFQVALTVDSTILERVFPDPEMFDFKGANGKFHTGQSAVSAGLLDDPEALLKMYTEMPTAKRNCQIIVRGPIDPSLLKVLTWDDSR